MLLPSTFTVNGVEMIPRQVDVRHSSCEKRTTVTIQGDLVDSHSLERMLDPPREMRQLPSGRPALFKPPGSYTDKPDMPQGFGNAMRNTEKTRDWVRQKRAEKGGVTSGLGVGVNIRKVPAHAGEFELHISIFDENRVFLCKDDFEVLEKIQETMEEMFS